MNRTSFTIAAFLGIVSSANVARACLWDYDTLKMERRQFPSVLELITGKFLRHSPEYYRWRIGDRTYQLQREPDNLRFYDDLAVAYDKLGEHEKAIETILKADKLQPNRYETYANLGTFHIHNGNLKEGLKYIERAIEINPDAHFGREVYQKLLVEYVLEIRKTGRKGVPLSPLEKDGTRKHSFASFVLKKQKPRDGEKQELKRAIKGVLGMMRFGHHDSPILLEALGDLLTAGPKPGVGATRLATRAYLKASKADKDEGHRYRDLALYALTLRAEGDLDDTIKTMHRIEFPKLSSEQDDADEWYRQLKADEIRWIESGADVDFEFSRKYYEEPTVKLNDGEPVSAILRAVGILFLLSLLAVPVSFVILYRRARRKHRSRADQQADDSPDTPTGGTVD